MDRKTGLARWLLAATLALTTLGAAAQSRSFSSLVVFGDGLVDSGNMAQLVGVDATQNVWGDGYYATLPFASGRYSNGPVWVEDLAGRLGLRADAALRGGSNYAFGGGGSGDADSITPIPGYRVSMQGQLSRYLAGPGSGDAAQSLFVLSGGSVNVGLALEAAGNDPAHAAGILGAAAQRYAADIGDMVDTMQAAGATHILVLNVADFGLTPRAQSYGPELAGLGSLGASLMNQLLAQRLAGEAGVQLFDLYGLLNDVVRHPDGTGLSNVSHACAAAQYGCDAGSSLFYDGQHPTAFGHHLIADRVYAALVPEPASAWLFGLGLLPLLARLRRRS
ncbi:SGNH/GDSL hydrolase family protein [Paucibacter sp. APW11]|uniref:SGNH/GDSL hydrolase family protein n=1 Tax=Roseateles aquae TaxID=3077235 RepID=A0ABU3PFT1_9BURK|nr:SGNH/GDSL hydrolase family protein [Paucibacter sp. APW11]MDT9000766.1 SGNH/GDSL hydrolase family protein [Paucibacter sp. APW11]